MAVVIPNTKDKDTFPEHFIAVANPPQRPYSASEVTWINNSASHIHRLTQASLTMIHSQVTFLNIHI